MELEICKLDDLHWVWERKYSFWHRPLILTAGYPKALIPFRVPNNITCMCVSPLSFHMEILLYQHGKPAIDTSRILFLLASTLGASCGLAMNHLIHVSVLSPPPRDVFVHFSSSACVCTLMCIYLFSCPSVPAPQLLILHCEYLVWCIVVVYQSYLLIVYALLWPWFG
jgi:hypothetical protein